jgi:2',3'-cyclic-nucleotide 2'-phosphodiesterase/3'-nucleotidase
MVWDEAWLAGRLWAEGIVEAAHRTVDALRAAGADVVVALCHSGLGPAGAAAADPEAENAALAVAAIGGIDAVVAGHTHEVFPSADLAGRAGCDTEAGRLAGRPATMPGWEGSHVGVIDLTLERGQGGRWRAAGGRGRVVACAAGGGPTGAAGRAVADIIAADHSALCRRMRRPMGATGTTISTRFALAGDSSAAGLIARACRAEAARMVAGTALEGVPVLGASAPFRCGGRAGPDSFTHIPPGPLRLRHLCELSPYPNRLDILRLTGAGLRAWLEHAAGLFATLAPGGQDQPLTEPATPAYLFDVIDGLTYRIDPSAPPRHGGPGPAGDGPGRIRDLCHEGRPVRDDAVFLLATSSYRVSGGGGFPGTGPGRSVMRSDMTVRDILARHLRRLAGPVQAAPPIWRFVPLPGTTAILTTAPGAAEGLPAGAQALGLDERGFLRVRLAL